jgi:hypothetical protein
MNSDITKEQLAALVNLNSALIAISNKFNSRGESVADLLQLGYCKDDTVNDFCYAVLAMINDNSDD